jgi:hypothetical protein
MAMAKVKRAMDQQGGEMIRPHHVASNHGPLWVIVLQRSSTLNR